MSKEAIFLLFRFRFSFEKIDYQHATTLMVIITVIECEKMCVGDVSMMMIGRRSRRKGV
jgi:hypothetical protein